MLIVKQDGEIIDIGSVLEWHIYTYDHIGYNELAKYHVDDGQWNCIFDNMSESPDDDIPF